MNLSSFQPPLVAILRGLTPAEAPTVGRLLFDAGWRLIEVPLNRPDALACIEALAAIAPADALIGGGTMLTPQDVDAVHAAGGRLMVAPNCEPAVIERARERGLLCMPGVATPTEALLALRCGAQALKLFPAEMIQPRGMAAMASVLPAGTSLWPVGGIAPESLGAWRQAGASGFGIGSALYRPGRDAAELARAAVAFVSAWRACST
jgi:2-dehydro-3-deoxyphosphogalactonate aldolase